MAEHKVTCFYAEIDKRNLYDDMIKLQTNSEVNINLVQKAKRETKRSRGKKPNKFHVHKPSPETDAYISWINKSNLSWKANTCMLS